MCPSLPPGRGQSHIGAISEDTIQSSNHSPRMETDKHLVKSRRNGRAKSRAEPVDPVCVTLSASGHTYDM